MRVITKPQRIEMMEAIEVSKELIGKVLTDSPLLKQEIVIENNGLILRAHEVESNNTYSSIQDIDIFLNEGDYLIKTPKGYMKPVMKMYKVDKDIEKAILKLNEVK